MAHLVSPASSNQEPTLCLPEAFLSPGVTVFLHAEGIPRSSPSQPVFHLTHVFSRSPAPCREVGDEHRGLRMDVRVQEVG